MLKISIHCIMNRMHLSIYIAAHDKAKMIIDDD